MTKAKSNGKEVEGLASYIERIESVEAEIATAKESIKALYSTAEVDGHDKAALKDVIKLRRSDLEKTAQVRAAREKMLKQLGELGATPLGEWATAYAAANVSARNRRAPKALTEEAAA